MALRRRYHYPGATYHVMLRGNDGQPIFFSDDDRCRLCLLIQEGCERYGHRILSYCFMTNHIHLAIQVDQVNLSRFMQNISFRYTRYVNWKMKRIGHLFQGRFKSVLVDSGYYLKEQGNCKTPVGRFVDLLPKLRLSRKRLTINSI